MPPSLEPNRFGLAKSVVIVVAGALILGACDGGNLQSSNQLTATPEFRKSFSRENRPVIITGDNELETSILFHHLQIIAEFPEIAETFESKSNNRIEIENLPEFAVLEGSTLGRTIFDPSTSNHRIRILNETDFLRAVEFFRGMRRIKSELSDDDINNFKTKVLLHELIHALFAGRKEIPLDNVPQSLKSAWGPNLAKVVSKGFSLVGYDKDGNPLFNFMQPTLLEETASDFYAWYLIQKNRPDLERMASLQLDKEFGEYVNLFKGIYKLDSEFPERLKVAKSDGDYDGFIEYLRPKIQAYLRNQNPKMANPALKAEVERVINELSSGSI